MKVTEQRKLTINAISSVKRKLFTKDLDTAFVIISFV